MNTSKRGDEPQDAVEVVGNLADPVRRRLYEHICAQTGPVTREEAATAVGISRTLAAYHLDKLAEAGLLETGYARPEGRSGPGAGRPAKHYTRSAQEVSVTLPARSYLLMADVLAAAYTADETGSVRAAAELVAGRVGRSAGEGTDVETALRSAGYEPVTTLEGKIEMLNCPFHQLSDSHTELVCGLNLELIGGLLEGTGQPRSRAHLCPKAGRCCVVIDPVRPAGTP